MEPKTIPVTDPGWEQRVLDPDVSELRVHQSDKGKTVSGYAVVWDARSEDLPFGREIIKRGAFRKSLKNADVRALRDHQPPKILGRNKAGTLRLKEDGHGLKVEIDPPDTTYANDMLESIDRGDLDGMSFRFNTIKDQWNTVDGQPLRYVLEAELIDVSVVTFPAYPQTEVAMRSLEAWQAEQELDSEPDMADIRRRRLALAELE